MRLRHWFYICNLGLLLALVAAVWKDQDRDWRDYQRTYYRMTADAFEAQASEAKDEAEKERLSAEAKGFRGRWTSIKQFNLDGTLGRIDRCITCHVGMDPYTNPSLTNDFTEQPYKAHPDVQGLVAAHPFAKFGCTSCHEGEGMATEADSAHGRVKFAEKQMRLQPFVQSSCVQCHADFERLEGAKTAARGKRLFVKHGCIGCHSINGKGGVISVDLGDFADKPVERISLPDFEGANMPPRYAKMTAKNWALAHLLRDTMQVVGNDPLARFNAEPISPSGMPPFYELLEDGDAEAIVTYLLSMTHKAIPRDFLVLKPGPRRPRPRSALKRGELVFHKYGCEGCHGIGGAKGWRNFNALGEGQDPEGTDPVAEMAKGREPTLTKVLGTYSREELKKKISEGVPGAQIVKFKADGPTPPLYMPSWKEKIKGRELDDLVTYLLSIAEEDEEAW